MSTKGKTFKVLVDKKVKYEYKTEHGAMQKVKELRGHGFKAQVQIPTPAYYEGETA